MAARTEHCPASLAKRLAAATLVSLVGTACSINKYPCNDGSLAATCAATAAAAPTSTDVTGSVALGPPATEAPPAIAQSAGTGTVQSAPPRPARIAKATQPRPACVAHRRVASSHARRSSPVRRAHRSLADFTGSLPRPLRRSTPAAALPPRSPWTWEGGTAITVGPNDTIEAISRRYGVPMSAIRQANGLGRGAAVAPGHRLVIPRYVSDPSAPAEAPTRPAIERPLWSPGGADMIASANLSSGIACAGRMSAARLAGSSNPASAGIYELPGP